MNNKFLIIPVVILAFGLFSCARQEAPAPSAPVSVKEVKPEAQGGWQEEWQKTQAEARKERAVTVYITLFGPVIRTISKTFTAKYGVEIEILPGRGEELTAKILAERRAGIYVNDVVISGFNTMFGFRRLGISAPLPPALILPEVIDPKLWYTHDSLPFGDEDRHLFAFIASPNRDIIINADVVNPDEIKSWKDLLDPRWRGKILWNDPTMAGSGFNGVSTLVYNKILDWDYYRQMVARQQIQLTRNQRQQVEWLAQKKFHIALSAESTPVAEFIKDGVNLKRVAVKEGTYVSAAAGVVFLNNRALHPNAARVFINWLLSREGQTLFAKESLRQSSRDDIPTDYLDSLILRQPGEKYFQAANAIEKWIYDEQEEYFRIVKELFGPLLR